MMSVYRRITCRSIFEPKAKHDPTRLLTVGSALFHPTSWALLTKSFCMSCSQERTRKPWLLPTIQLIRTTSPTYSVRNATPKDALTFARLDDPLGTRPMRHEFPPRTASRLSQSVWFAHRYKPKYGSIKPAHYSRAPVYDGVFITA